MLRRGLGIAVICIACVAEPMQARAEDAQDSPAPASSKAAPPSAMVSLIDRLAAKGLLTKQDKEDLTSMAEADAADARVEAAEARLAAAKAEAAAARARAALARANAELELARASAAQVAANQTAAVRLLLGQGQAGAETAAATPPVGTTPSVPTPDATENPHAPAAAPEIDSVPEKAAPPPSPRRAIVQEDAAPTDSSTVAAATTQPSPEPAVETPPAAAPVGDSSGAVTETEAAPGSAAETPAASGSMKLTRNDDGAIVVPEDSDATQGKATSVPAESAESTAAAAPVQEDPAAGDSARADSTPSSDARAAAPTATAEAAPVQEDPAAPSKTSAETEAAASSASDAATQAEPTESLGNSGPPRSVAEAPAAGAAEPVSEAASEPAAAPDEVVRVAYVPEVVKNQIREEVKNEVVAEARKENWGAPTSGPEWVSKFTLYGDIRIRAEELINHGGNDNTGAFPNFNAINTGAPFDTAGNVFSPQYNVDQNRNRERLRARLGFAVDVTGGFTVGLRLATGNDNNPVTENQTFGASGNAQGGDFSKYSLWLDRAYIKYQSSGNQGPPFWMSFGRFDNPFFSTSMIWANDIGFDGFAASIPVKTNLSGRPSGDIKPFLVAGAFPIFNTDLNYATNSPTKFKSYDKWLYAGQLGVDAKLSDDLQLKLAAALYEYKNIEGQLSSPFTPLTASDAGDTDASRPSFAQNGNTYMALRNITPGPLNNNGTIDQFQYYGLATPFKEFAITEGLYYNHFEPFQVSLVSEWVKNLAFNPAAVAAVAVNNGGSANFIGGNTGWMTTLKFGDIVIQDLGDWSVNVGYRRIESDAVVDGFNDADFGGDLLGTNLKGFTLGASLGISRDVWLEARWMSASAIAGPIYKNDLLQLDLNAKF